MREAGTGARIAIVFLHSHHSSLLDSVRIRLSSRSLEAVRIHDEPMLFATLRSRVHGLLVRRVPVLHGRRVHDRRRA